MFRSRGDDSSNFFSSLSSLTTVQFAALNGISQTEYD